MDNNIIIFGDEFELSVRCWVVGANVSTFDLRRSMCQPSKIDVSTFEDRRSMCRPSRIDDRRVDLRRWMIDVPTFKDRWSLCRPAKTDDRCEIMLLHLLKPLIQYYSCMRIAPRVCTSVLSFSKQVGTEICVQKFSWLFNYARK